MNSNLGKLLPGLLCAISGAVLAGSAFGVFGVPFVAGAILGAILGLAAGNYYNIDAVLFGGVVFTLTGFIGWLLFKWFMLRYPNAEAHGCGPVGQLICYLVGGWTCGSLFGSLIVNGARVQTCFRAVALGASVGLLSFWVTVGILIYLDPDKHTGMLDPISALLVITFLMGWTTIIPSAIAGYILYRLRERREEREHQRTRLYKSSDTSNPTLNLDVNATRKFGVNHDQPQKDQEE